MSTIDDDDRFEIETPEAPPRERQEPRDAPAEGGSSQGVSDAGSRGTSDGGLAAEDDVGMEGGGLTGAVGSDDESAPWSE